VLIGYNSEYVDRVGGRSYAQALIYILQQSGLEMKICVMSRQKYKAKLQCCSFSLIHNMCTQGTKTFLPTICTVRSSYSNKQFIFMAILRKYTVAAV